MPRTKANTAAGITTLAVQGFKSINKRLSLEIRPLTILAGPNSAGKSSFVQPFLVMRQTLDSSYDRESLLLAGPHLEVGKGEDLFFRDRAGKRVREIRVGARYGSERSITAAYKLGADGDVSIASMTQEHSRGQIVLRPGMSHSAIEAAMGSDLPQLQPGALWHVVPERCFLKLEQRNGERQRLTTRLSVEGLFSDFLHGLRHVKCGDAQPRQYDDLHIDEQLPGKFDRYVGALLKEWKQRADFRSKLDGLAKDLQMLGLTRSVEARSTESGLIEVLVDRLPLDAPEGTVDLMNIVDMGSAVTAVLPFLVALHDNESYAPYAVVWAEQPETDLHPRAQLALAKVLAGAVQRGCQVVVETHSSLLLLGVQSLVAEATLAPDDVALNWFSRSPSDGATRVAKATLDEAGRFGDWPEDFGDVELEAQSRYLTAAEAALAKDGYG